VALGIGDDGAVINPEPDTQLVVATDTLVESVHFPADASAQQIATRALCVNLSDMAAMGAKPKWFTLALTIPPDKANAQWLGEFSRGLAEVAAEFDIALIGGDTTAGPLTISITLMAEVPVGKALKRAGAKVGDAVYVTGDLGDGAAALALITGNANTKGDSEYLLERFYRPRPMVEAGIALRDIASACIDISDGLIADLGHICKASGVSAQIYTENLPIHPDVVEMSSQHCVSWALAGGDDYQLCFTVPPSRQEKISHFVRQGELKATLVGHIEPNSESRELVVVDGQSAAKQNRGFDHFGQ
jgi:thiamine-monophosphate kinase